MQIKQGTQVYSASGEKVGVVERVAVDPKSRTVTHLVVRKGLLFSRDKIIPMDWVADARDEQVTLQPKVGDLDSLPDFEEQYFVPDDPGVDEAIRSEYVPTMYWYPPVAIMPLSPEVDDQRYDQSPFIPGSPQALLGDSIAVEAGALVLSADDQEVGKVEHILLDPGSNQVQDLVIARGLLSKERKHIPALWVESVTGDEVRLAVEAKVVEWVPDYQEND